MSTDFVLLGELEIKPLACRRSDVFPSNVPDPAPVAQAGTEQRAHRLIDPSSIDEYQGLQIPSQATLPC